MKKAKGDTHGDAMILVLCVLCVFTTLSLTVLLSSSILMATTQQMANREQAKLSSITFASVIENDIVTGDADTGTITAYLKSNLPLTDKDASSWSCYDGTNREVAEKAFDFGKMEHLGTLTAALYWENMGSSKMDGLKGDSLDIRLIVAVTCDYEGEIYKQTTHYERKITVEETAEENPTVLWKWDVVWKE